MKKDYQKPEVERISFAPAETITSDTYIPGADGEWDSADPWA